MEELCETNNNNNGINSNDTNSNNNNNNINNNNSNFDKYVDSYVKNYDILWNQKSHRKWREEDFRVYCLKKKVLDNFANKVLQQKGGGKRGRRRRRRRKRDEEEEKEVQKMPFIAYGDAKFSATGTRHSSRNSNSSSSKSSSNCASPASRFAKLLERKVDGAAAAIATTAKKFFRVNEWNTSKVCHRCFKPVQGVRCIEEKEEEGEEREKNKKQEISYVLRGIQRCSSDKKECPLAGKFLNRDSNAATNIALRMLMSPLPELLVIGNRVKTKPKPFDSNRIRPEKPKRRIIERKKKEQIKNNRTENQSQCGRLQRRHKNDVNVTITSQRPINL